MSKYIICNYLGASIEDNREAGNPGRTHHCNRRVICYMPLFHYGKAQIYNDSAVRRPAR